MRWVLNFLVDETRLLVNIASDLGVHVTRFFVSFGIDQ